MRRKDYVQSGLSGLASGRLGRGHSGDRGACGAALDMRMMAPYRARPAALLDKGRWEDHEAAFGRAGRFVRGVGLVHRRLSVRRKLGRAGLSRGSHLDFDTIAAAGPSALPALIAARPRAFQSEIHHCRRRRPAEGDAGDHPDQAQERRQSAVQPHQRAGFELLLRLPQRPRRRRFAATTSPTCSSRRASRARSSTTTDPSFSSERHTDRADGAASSSCSRAR